MKTFEKYFKQLIDIPSPTGFTEQIMDQLEALTKSLGFEPTRTNKGALVVKVGGNNHEHSRVIASHADTLGAMVREIKSNGRLKFINIGGLPFPAVEAENVTIHTSNGKTFTGTAMPNKPSTHLFPEDVKKAVRDIDSMEIRIDEDVKSKDDTLSLGINVGDFITFETRTEFTPSGYLKSRYIDDKGCCAILLCVLEELKDIKLENDHYFIFSDFEEVGHGIYGIDKSVKEILSVDIGVVGIGQNASEKEVSIFAKDGKTPYHRGLTQALISLAKKHSIPHNIDIVEFYGSDATAALSQGKDVKFALIGPGVEATHHYERTHLDSIKATKDLLLEFLKTPL